MPYVFGLGHLGAASGTSTSRHEVHSQSSEKHNQVNWIEWRKPLRSFSNVKTLCVDNGLVEELPLELLPELQELTLVMHSPYSLMPART